MCFSKDALVVMAQKEQERFLSLDAFLPGKLVHLHHETRSSANMLKASAVVLARSKCSAMAMLVSLLRSIFWNHFILELGLWNVVHFHCQR